LVQDFALVVPSLVICELLDVPYSEHEFFQRHSKTIFAIDATAEQVGEARAAIGEFWQQMIDAREKIRVTISSARSSSTRSAVDV
jgi:cytochrome P450